jgi:pathogenesis-related protein 1
MKVDFVVIISLVASCARQDSAQPVSPPSESNEAGGSAPAATGEKAPPDMQAMLEAHNRLRAQHCAAPLVWSDSVARAAKAWADHLAARGCMLQHSETQYGENLSGGSAGTQTPAEVANVWYRENGSYNFAVGGFSMRSGHFTQVVWRGSQRLGCASAACGDLRVWVCNYDPPGNMEGDFQRNVLPTSCAAH